LKITVIYGGMRMKKSIILSMLLGFVVMPLYANVVVIMYSTQAQHQKIGSILFKNKARGLLITTQLTDLPPGPHGFHLHNQPSCDHQGQAAGGHYDPHDTQKHLGPYKTLGHAGDLPVLVVDKNGNAKRTLFAPHLQESDLYGHAVMIHAGGDNYSDSPKPLGGGGDRIACGIIAAQKNG
jgi:Cu-Zn family superoxide dismutase